MIAAAVIGLVYRSPRLKNTKKQLTHRLIVRTRQCGIGECNCDRLLLAATSEPRMVEAIDSRSTASQYGSKVLKRRDVSGIFRPQTSDDTR